MNRRPLKIIFTVLLVLIFIVSALFNILAFNTSYASLMFKYDKNTLQTMHFKAYEPIKYDNLEKGYIVKGENIDGCDSFEAQYYINESSEIEMKTVCSVKEQDKEVTTTYYYKNNKIFIDSGDKKQKIEGSFVTYRASYPDVFDYYDIALEYDLNAENYKTKMDFSFAPFYTLGIKYSFSVKDSGYESPFTATYQYDLKGRLRKIILDNEEEPSKLSIRHKNKSIEYPDLTAFK